MEQEKAAGFIEEHLKTIFAYALSRVSHKEDAEDLAGDIILAILESAPNIRDEHAFFGYIWAIAANTYKKFLRKKSRRHYEELPDLPSEEDFVQEILQSEEFHALHRELSLLSKEYRECTIAYYFEGLSCAETASKLHISLNMVKYYLFKTRKILKEGIAMEREFGTKSYQPAKFLFVTIFSDRGNVEYQNLFNRKLPGNILLSTYYSPMTVRELAVELGVAAVYLEDEIALLEKYHLLKALSKGRYQTNLIIFTKAYTDEFNKAASKYCYTEVPAILSDTRQNLSQIRQLGFTGSDMDENRLLWSLLFLMMHRGNAVFENTFESMHGSRFHKDPLYHGATGTNYGMDYDETEEEGEYECLSCAGYYKLTNKYAAAYADFAILPEKNRFTAHCEAVKKSLEAVSAGEAKPMLPTLGRAEQKALEHILKPQIEAFGRLYENLYDCALSIMKEHAPEHTAAIADNIVAGTLFFRTAGLIGAYAVQSGALSIPDMEGPLAAILYQIES